MELYKIKRETPGIIHIKKLKFCSKCCKKVELVKRVTIPLKKYESSFDSLEEKIEDSIEIYHCSKCNQYYVYALFNNVKNKLKNAYPSGKIDEIKINELVVSCPSYTVDGINYNEETGCLSLYRSIMEYAYINTNPNKTFLKKVPTIDRITLNLKTGAVYEYTKERKRRQIRRRDFNYMLNANYFDKELILKFVQTAFEKTKIPVNCCKYEEESRFYWNDKHKETFFKLICGESEITSLNSINLLSLVSWIIKSPSVWIRYDSYKNEASFRYTNIDKDYIIDRLYDDKHNNVIRVFTPLSDKFKKAFTTRELVDEGEYVKDLVNKMSISKSKSLMKLYRKNPLLIGYTKWVNECGIKEVDNIYKMFNLLNRIDYWERALISSYKKLIKALIAFCGETNAVNKLLLTVNGSMLADTARMYDAISRANIEFEMSGTIGEIHDRLSVTYNTIQADINNREIPHTKTEEEREFIDGNIEIKLAEDTKRLIEIGNAMHICVGSYGNRAVSKDCTIYYAERNGTYVACFELRKNRLIQAKGYCNNMLEGDIAKTVKKWVEEKKLFATTCYDYNKMSLPTPA